MSDRFRQASACLLASGLLALGCKDSLAPDRLVGDQLVFRSFTDGGLDLMQGDGSGRRLIYSDTDLVMFASWSPDGSQIAFHKFLANQIFVLNVSTGLVRQLTLGPDEHQSPMWSPDGARIAFCDIPAGAAGYPLFVMNADGLTNAARLGTGTFTADRGSWSPDGSWIAATSATSHQIVLVNTRTGDVGPGLTVGSLFASAPSWSPDGTMIAFMGFPNGSGAIFVMRADGSGVRQLTQSYADPSVQDGYPVWTPDGSMITFHRYRPNGVGPPISTLHLITPSGAAVSWPAGAAVDGDLPIWRPKH